MMRNNPDIIHSIVISRSNKDYFAHFAGQEAAAAATTIMMYRRPYNFEYAAALLGSSRDATFETSIDTKKLVMTLQSFERILTFIIYIIIIYALSYKHGRHDYSRIVRLR